MKQFNFNFPDFFTFGFYIIAEINCWQEWLVFSDIFFFLMKSGCIDFVDFIDKLGSRLSASDHQILNKNHVTWLLAQIIRVEHVMTALNTDSRKVASKWKISLPFFCSIWYNLMNF